MKDLIKEYEDKLADVNETIELTSNNGSQNDIGKMARLRTKASCYKTFIEKLTILYIKNEREARLEKRTKECISLEMRFNGETFVGFNDYNSDFNIHHSEMICDTDIEWWKKINGMQAELERRKK